MSLALVLAAGCGGRSGLFADGPDTPIQGTDGGVRTGTSSSGAATARTGAGSTSTSAGVTQATSGASSSSVLSSGAFSSSVSSSSASSSSVSSSGASSCPGLGDCGGPPGVVCQARAGVACPYCSDLVTDPDNCGACGNVCPPDEPICSGGACSLCSCAAGDVCCSGGDAGSNPSAPYCANTASDPLNCGGCGLVCSAANAVAGCLDGVCVIEECDPGFAVCDGMPGDGCPIDTNLDVDNCGSCGNGCPVGANATPTCSEGMCGIACMPGYAQCDIPGMDGCLINLMDDPLNCGVCGLQCPSASPTNCNLGVCTGG
jgi:hypothetical protein